MTFLLYSGPTQKTIPANKAKLYASLYSSRRIHRDERGRAIGLILNHCPADFRPVNGDPVCLRRNKMKSLSLPKLPDSAFVREPGQRPLVEAYRPLTLDELLGQSQTVKRLKDFAANPFSQAMLFAGESGVGKTSAAMAMAAALGCDMDQEELGGVFTIKSGKMLKQTVEGVLDLLRYRPLFGSGWKVIIANEADTMGKTTEELWLDTMEPLPPRTAVMFTTNDPARLTRRFRDRCESFNFTAEPRIIQPWIQALCLHVWQNEGHVGLPPALDRLGMPTLGKLEDMNNPSFRLALQQLQAAM